VGTTSVIIHTRGSEHENPLRCPPSCEFGLFPDAVYQSRVGVIPQDLAILAHGQVLFSLIQNQPKISQIVSGRERKSLRIRLISGTYSLCFRQRIKPTTEPSATVPSINGRAMGIVSHAMTISPPETIAPARVPGTVKLPNVLRDAGRCFSLNRSIKVPP
jgi:hypothetical protein